MTMTPVSYTHLTEIAINDALFDGETYYVIRIPQDFGKQMLDPERNDAELNAQGSIYVHLSICLLYTSRCV